MIIAINGKNATTVAKIIQYIQSNTSSGGKKLSYNEYLDMNFSNDWSGWEIVRFDTKLKQIASILSGYPLHVIDNSSFLKNNIGEEWDQEIISMPCGCDWIMDYGNDNKKCNNCGTPIKSTTEPYTGSAFLEKINSLLGNVHHNYLINALFNDYVPQAKQISDDIGKGTEYVMNGIHDKKYHPNWLITDLTTKYQFQKIIEQKGIIIKLSNDSPIIFEGEVHDYDLKYDSDIVKMIKKTTELLNDIGI